MDFARLHALRRQLRRRDNQYWLRVGGTDVPLAGANRYPAVRAWLDVLLREPVVPEGNPPALGSPGVSAPLSPALAAALAAVGREAPAPSQAFMRPYLPFGALSGRRVVLDWLSDLGQASGTFASEGGPDLAASLGGAPRGRPEFCLRWDDVAKEAPSLLAAREALLAAVRAHDLATLQGLTDPDVAWDAHAVGLDAPGAGWAGLQEELNADVYLWAAIEAALALGGALDARGHYVAPWFWAHWTSPFPLSEAGRTAAAPSTWLYAEPFPGAPPIRDIGGEYVSLREPGEMAEVTTMDGLVGFVEPSRLEGLYGSGFHVVLAPWRGGWRLVTATLPGPG